MKDVENSLVSSPGARGCVRTALALVALPFVAPAAAAVRQWRRMNRGTELRSTLETLPFETTGDEAAQSLDLTIDAPQSRAHGLQSRVTDAVVRVAESLRDPQDIYHLVYRLPWEHEPVLIPIRKRMGSLFGALCLETTSSISKAKAAVASQ